MNVKAAKHYGPTGKQQKKVQSMMKQGGPDSYENMITPRNVSELSINLTLNKAIDGENGES